MNNIGAVAFSTNNNIYLGNGNEVVKVVDVGDSLDGSTVTSASLPSGAQEDGGHPLNDLDQVAYSVSLANGNTALVLFTPALHWENASGGSWNSSTWTLGLVPASIYDVYLDPSIGVTLALSLIHI